MSNALQTRTLFSAVASAMVAAWSVTSVDPGRPRTSDRTLPYGAVGFDPVSIDWNGQNTIQSHGFTAVGRFEFPANPDTHPIELEKVDRANELIAQLQTGPNFATVGLLPLVTSVSFDESDDVEEGAYEVTLSFSVQTVQVHH